MTEAPGPDAAHLGEEPLEALVDEMDSNPEATGEESGEMVGESEQDEEPAAAGDGDELALAHQGLADRTVDLQRVQAEFVNFKRRVERDRDLVRQNATYAVLAPIVEVLDTIDRASEHGELDGGFKTVAEQLQRTVSGLGLTKFGVAGDPFDPMLHEALSHLGQSSEVTVTTCQVVAKAGYRIGERVVRAAQVLVVDPADPS